MKNYLTLIFGSLLLFICACSSDKGGTGGGGGGDDRKPEVIIENSTVTLNYLPGTSASVSFSSSGDWTITNNNPADLSISPTSGKSGKQTVTVKSQTANQTNAERSLTFSIKPNGGTAKTVTVKQAPVFVLDKVHFDVSSAGETITISMTTDLDDNLSIRYGGDFGEMWEKTANTRATGSEDVKVTRAANKFSFDFKILPNKTKSVKEGFFSFVHNRDDVLQSEMVVITQMPDGVGESTDYSRDGEVSTLLKHSGVEQGIPVVLMGDAYIDKEIENGQYMADIQKACDYLFNIEPMKSLKNCFDVYSVVAVSKNNVISDKTSTAFKTEFDKDGSTYVFGDADICMKYAKKAVTDPKRLDDDALIVVIVNDGRKSGTCMPVVTDQPQNGTPTGYSIAFVPVNNDEFEAVYHHEVIGHGMGKLADEYGSDNAIYAGRGSILDDQESLDDLKFCQEYFAMLNVSLESDPLKTPWAKLYQDSRFAAEKLGAYEGAYTFPKDAYRATKESMMRNNVGGFNAISREAIYKRVQSIAHNHNWTYDYEDFVKFDEPARKATKAVIAAPSGLQRKHVGPIWKIEHK